MNRVAPAYAVCKIFGGNKVFVPKVDLVNGFDKLLKEMLDVKKMTN